MSEQDKPARKCDDCKHRSGWRTEFYSRGPQKMVVADCMHPEWPDWWKARGERPLVTPGAGTGCHKYERLAREQDKPAAEPCGEAKESR